MNGDKFFNVLGGIITIGLVTTLVLHENTASVIRAGGSAFQGILRTAITGR